LLDCAEDRLAGNRVGNTRGLISGSNASKAPLQFLNGRLLKGARAESTDIPGINHPARFQPGLIGSLGRRINTAGDDTAGQDRGKEKPLEKSDFSGSHRERLAPGTVLSPRRLKDHSQSMTAGRRPRTALHR
jgi:hypothetical protein